MGTARGLERAPVFHCSDMAVYPREGAWHSGVLVDGPGRLHTSTTLLHPFYQNTTPQLTFPVPQRQFFGSDGAVPTTAGGAFQNRGADATMVAPSTVVAGTGPRKESTLARISAPPTSKRKNDLKAPVATDDSDQESKRQRTTPRSIRKEIMQFCKANGKFGRGLAKFGEFIKESAPIVELYSGQILDLNLVPNNILTIVSPPVVEDSGCPHVFEFATLAE